MELDVMRRKAEEDKQHFRQKNITYKNEIEDLVKQNQKLTQEKTALTSRLQSLRSVNKQLENKLKNQMEPLKKNQIFQNTDKRL
jgi:predicted  nucleic acid-binding Zn-ribbon protein